MLFAHAQDMEEAKAIIEADIDTLIADAMAAQSGSQTLSKEYNV
jgi:hypothetical protein